MSGLKNAFSLWQFPLVPAFFDYAFGKRVYKTAAKKKKKKNRKKEKKMSRCHKCALYTYNAYWSMCDLSCFVWDQHYTYWMRSKLCKTFF